MGAGLTSSLQVLSFAWHCRGERPPCSAMKTVTEDTHNHAHGKQLASIFFFFFFFFFCDNFFPCGMIKVVVFNLGELHMLTFACIVIWRASSCVAFLIIWRASSCVAFLIIWRASSCFFFVVFFFGFFIDDHLYSAILRSFEQTHCARLWFYMSD